MAGLLTGGMGRAGGMVRTFDWRYGQDFWLEVWSGLLTGGMARAMVRTFDWRYGQGWRYGQDF